MIPLELDPDRLFPADRATRDLARRLYAEVEDLPIVSPHGHTDPQWYADDTPFPNASALFALVRRHSVARVLSAPDKVIPEVGRFGGTVLHTTLSAEDDKRLQAAIDEAHHRAEALSSATLVPRQAHKKRIVNPTGSSARTNGGSAIPTPRASAEDERPF